MTRQVRDPDALLASPQEPTNREIVESLADTWSFTKGWIKDVETSADDADLVLFLDQTDEEVKPVTIADVLSGRTLTDLKINDTSEDHQYVVTVSELTANRNINLPLLTGNDEFTFNSHAQTLTNKTINFANNSVTTTFSQLNTAVSDATLVSLTATQTLTNKTLTSPTINGSTSFSGAITQTVTGSSSLLTVTAPTTGETSALYLGAESSGVYSMSIAAQGAFAGDKGLSIRQGSIVGNQLLFINYANGNITSTGDFLPAVTESQNIGSASFEIDNIYLQNAATVSDERRKDSLGELDDKWVTFFDLLVPELFTYKDREVIPAKPATTKKVQRTRKVEEEYIEVEHGKAVLKTRKVDKPVFEDLPLVDEKGNPVLDEKGKPRTFKNSVMDEVPVPAEPARVVTHSRPHTGFMAQKVKAALDEAGIEDWAGYAYDEESDKHFLRLQEFIAPMLYYIKVKHVD